MKKLCLLVLALVAAVAMNAAGYKYLTVNMKDGSTVEIALSETLNLAFTADKLNVTGSTADVSIDRAKIASFTHSRESALDDISSDAPALENCGDCINLRNLPAGTHAALYTIGGVQMRSAVADAAGCASFPLGGLQPGAYVISAGNVSFKVMVK